MALDRELGEWDVMLGEWFVMLGEWFVMAGWEVAFDDNMLGWDAELGCCWNIVDGCDRERLGEVAMDAVGDRLCTELLFVARDCTTTT